MLGRVFKSGRLSAVDTAQYKKLPQEEEEEDNVLFKRDGKEISHKQNGVHNEGEDDLATANGTTQVTGSPSSEIPELVQVRVYKAPTLTRTRLACYSLSVIFCLLLASLFAFVIPYSKMFHRLVIGQTYDATPPWNKTFLDSVSDSPIRLVDIDNDNRLDVIFATSSSHIIKDGESLRECPSKDGTYPCSSQLYAIRGYDGEEMWHVDLEGAVVAINCLQLVNNGQIDCLISGHRGLLVKVNSKTGKILWSSKKIGDRVVVHHPLVLPDINGDGVSDIVVSVTGDPTFRNLGDGKLILISSKTGSILGESFTVPFSSSASEPTSATRHAPATNIPPVLHTSKDGSQYILFGSGGLNQPGGLYAISLPDFVRRVMKWNNTHIVPNTSGEYKAWKHATTNEKTNVIRIWESSTKGIVVPPVCADVNGDGTNDILVTTASGIVKLYKGETLEELWKYEVDDSNGEYETLSQPGPGYFNSDKTLDFMLHLNLGTWPMYSGSKAVIINGVSGEAMWTYQSSSPEFTSDLIIGMKKNRDAFLVHLQVDEKARRKRYDRDRDRDRQWPRRKHPTYPRQPEDEWSYPRYSSDITSGNYQDSERDDQSYNTPRQYNEEYNPDYISQLGSSRQKYAERYDTEGGPVQPEFIPRTGKKKPPKVNSRRRLVVEPQKTEKPFHPCAMSQMIDKGDIYIMDRTNFNKPIRIFKHEPSIAPNEKSNCSFYHHGTSIGAVGDIDGDIHHELIVMFHTHQAVDGIKKPALKLQKINLKDTLKQDNSIMIKAEVSETMGNHKQLQPLQSKLLLHDGVQHWTQYMGKSGRSIY